MIRGQNYLIVRIMNISVKCCSYFAYISRITTTKYLIQNRIGTRMALEWAGLYLWVQYELLLPGQTVNKKYYLSVMRRLPEAKTKIISQKLLVFAFFFLYYSEFK